MTDVYSADEAFVTGTFSELVPVKQIDGRIIGEGKRAVMVEKLQGHYESMLEREYA